MVSGPKWPLDSFNILIYFQPLPKKRWVAEIVDTTKQPRPPGKLWCHQTRSIVDCSVLEGYLNRHCRGSFKSESLWVQLTYSSHNDENIYPQIQLAHRHRSVGVDSLSPTRGTSTLCCIWCIAIATESTLSFRAYCSLYSSRNIRLRTSLRALSKELATLRSHRPSLTLSRGYTNIVAGFTPRDEFIV